MAAETRTHARPAPNPGGEVVCTKETWPDPAVLDRLFAGATPQDKLRVVAERGDGAQGHSRNRSGQARHQRLKLGNRPR